MMAPRDGWPAARAGGSPHPLLPFPAMTESGPDDEDLTLDPYADYVTGDGGVTSDLVDRRPVQTRTASVGTCRKE